MSILECRDLCITRGQAQVVSDLTLSVRQGEWLAVVGPNGAGKTSLLHAIAGLIPLSGERRSPAANMRVSSR